MIFFVVLMISFVVTMLFFIYQLLQQINDNILDLSNDLTHNVIVSFKQNKKKGKK